MSPEQWAREYLYPELKREFEEQGLEVVSAKTLASLKAQLEEARRTAECDGLRLAQLEKALSAVTKELEEARAALDHIRAKWRNTDDANDEAVKALKEARAQAAERDQLRAEQDGLREAAQRVVREWDADDGLGWESAVHSLRAALSGSPAGETKPSCLECGSVAPNSHRGGCSEFLKAAHSMETK